jgi:hypothetical protein
MPDSQLQDTLTQILNVLTSLEELAQDLVQKKKAAKALKKTNRTELYTPEFMSLWNTYNKKTGKTEAARAYAAFKKRQMKSRFYIDAGFETPEEMLLDKIKAYVQAWPPSRIQTGDYRVHLSTFINQDRWQEDPSDWTDPEANFQEQGGPVWTE